MAAADATWSYMRSQRCSIGFKSVGREGQHQHHQCPHHLWNCWQTPATWGQALPCKRRNQRPTAPEYGPTMGLRSLFQFPTAVKVPLCAQCEPALVQVWARTMDNRAPMLNMEIPVLWLLHRPHVWTSGPHTTLMEGVWSESQFSQYTRILAKGVYRRSCFRGVVYDVYFASTTFPFFFFFFNIPKDLRCISQNYWMQGWSQKYCHRRKHLCLFT